MTVIDALSDLIFTPGSSLALLPVINVTCVLLVLVCLTMIYYGIAVLHMLVLIALSLGLLGSVQFLKMQIDKVGGIDAGKGGGKASKEGDDSKVD